MRQIIGSVLLLLCVLSAPGQARGWGVEGHETIATIAEKLLTPAARRKIAALLADDRDGTSLAAVSTWADRIRNSRPETAPWHYVDIPVAEGAATGYDARRDCPTDACVVAQISHHARIMADPVVLRALRAESLKFVVHLVGDIHQPLHCGENDDHGGNKIRVVFNGKKTNLHWVWDTGLVEALDDHRRPLAVVLLKQIGPAERLLWSQIDPIAWANESWAISKTFVYPSVGDVRGGTTAPIVLPATYDDVAAPGVAVQLAKAGVRLAAILNAAFR